MQSIRDIVTKTQKQFRKKPLELEKRRCNFVTSAISRPAGHEHGDILYSSEAGFTYNTSN